MNRFQWGEINIDSWESSIRQQTGVAVYDGDEKTNYVNGTLTLTTHKLMWKDNYSRSALLLPLQLVVYLEEQAGGFVKSAKIVVHLQQPAPGQPSGPVSTSKYDFIRFSFRDSGEREFFRYFNEALRDKRWEQKVLPQSSTQGAQGARHRPGIVGIERSIQQKQKQTDVTITQSFQDLKQLMDKAKEMVSLSKSIVNKIKEKQGEITEDETVKFKAYLLSMGIPNPVTRETHGTGDRYLQELARELASVLQKPIEEGGGMMTLTDVYCRVNRARGMELLSPEDLLNACEMFEMLKLPVRLRVFASGVKVIQSSSHSEEEVIKNTAATVEEKGSVTAEELSHAIGLSVILAKERLLLTERVGGVCRDDNVEGLRFYPNLFLTKT